MSAADNALTPAAQGLSPRQGFAIAALLLAPHLVFVWQWDRFLLPLLPLLAAVMALPLAPRADHRLRVAGAALLAASLAIALARPAMLAPPDTPAYDTATLRRIAARH